MEMNAQTVIDGREYVTVPKGGRPKKVYSQGYLENVSAMSKKLSMEQMIALYKVSRATMYRLIRKAKDATEEAEAKS